MTKDEGQMTMDALWQDIRYGLRMLLKNPGFTAVAVLTLALGIGANTAIFSFVNGILLRPLPFKEPERLVWFWETQPDQPKAPFSAPEFLDYQSQNQTLDQMAAVRQMNFNLTGVDPVERLRGAIVSVNFFSLLGVQPLLGRDFRPEEGQPGAPRVVLLSHGLWQRRLGSEPNILGHTLTLSDESVTVIGVLPPEFQFLPGIELWLNPHHIVPEPVSNYRDQHLTMRGLHYLSIVGRLKPDVTLAQAQADLDTIARRLQQQHPGQANHGVHLITLHERRTGYARAMLLTLFAAAGFVLLIACANVANLLLVRATGRQKEIAIRAALGAGRGRLVRQLLTESLLLGLLGGAIGLLAAVWGVDLLRTASPPDIPRLEEIRIDQYVLGFTLGASLLTGLLFGTAPALRVSRPALTEALKEGGSRSTVASPSRNWLSSVLIVSEVALSAVLLIGAGLLVHSFVRLLDVEPGFNPDKLITMRISFSGKKYTEDARRVEFLRQLLERLEALPGVRGVAVANGLPLEGQDITSTPVVEGRPPNEFQDLGIGTHAVNPGYFRAMGVPLLKGRFFSERDGADGPPVVIINEALARRFWPDEDPIGKRISLFAGSHSHKFAEVIGVVGNVRYTGLAGEISLDAYAPYEQVPWPYITVAMRTAIDPTSLVAAVRQEVKTLDPELPIYSVRTMERVMMETLGLRPLMLVLTGLFALLALLLAAVGIHGVMSYSVSRRTHEIGIRMALGAQPHDVLRLMVGQGMVLVLVGVGLGLAGSLAMTRFLKSWLFGVTPTDPMTFAIVSLLLMAVALLASYIPARRATRVDPMVALRYE